MIQEINKLLIKEELIHKVQKNVRVILKENLEFDKEHKKIFHFNKKNL